MSILRSNQFGLEEDETVNASSTVEMLEAFDNDADVDENVSATEKSKLQKGTGDRS